MKHASFLLLAAALAVAPAAAQELPAWASPSAPTPPPPAAPMETNPGVPGNGDQQVPVDGGLSLLAAAGAGYAVNRLRRRRRDAGTA